MVEFNLFPTSSFEIVMSLSFCRSTCERFVAYVAEPKAAPTQKPLFGAPPKSASEKEIPLDAPSAFDYKDDWSVVSFWCIVFNKVLL